MAKYNVVFSLLGILAQYIAVPVLTEKFRIRDSTLGALAWLTISGSAVIMALATAEWLIWVAVTVAFLELIITPSIRSIISKVVGPFEVGAVFSILATFQAENFVSLICDSKITSSPRADTGCISPLKNLLGLVPTCQATENL